VREHRDTESKHRKDREGCNPFSLLHMEDLTKRILPKFVPTLNKFFPSVN
jgi:hypothetical protein